MVLPAHATNKVKNDLLIDHTYNLEAWLTNEQAIYAIVSYLPVSYLLSIIMSSNWEGICEVEFSLSLYLS